MGAWHHLTGNLLWVFGSLVLLANWHFTLLAITPANTRLKVIRREEAAPATRALLVSWGKLHTVRSMLGAVSTITSELALAVTA